jgi:hypothetical protein
VQHLIAMFNSARILHSFVQFCSSWPNPLSLYPPLILAIFYCSAMSTHTNIKQGPQLICFSTQMSLPNEVLRMTQLANAASCTHFDNSTLLDLTLFPSTSHSSQLPRRSIVPEFLMFSKIPRLPLPCLQTKI